MSVKTRRDGKEAAETSADQSNRCEHSFRSRDCNAMNKVCTLSLKMQVWRLFRDIQVEMELHEMEQ